MHYLKSGTGPPLLLVHGLMGGSFCWRFNLTELALRHTTYAVDLPGLGLSRASDQSDLGMHAQAMRLLHFLELNRVEGVDVVASSWGGAVAIYLATLTRKLRSLVLISPVNPWSKFGRGRIRFFRSFGGAWLLRCGLPFSGRLHRTALERLYGDPTQVRQDTVEGYSSILKQRGRARSLVDILRRWENDVEGLRDLVPGVEVPVLLVWGDRDGAVDLRSASALQQALPQSELVVVPGVGHLPFEEAPEVFNRLVLDFVQRQR